MSEPTIPPTPTPGEPPGPPPGAPPPAQGDGDNRTVMIILSYLYILALVPLLVEKEDAEIQWHAKHGLVFLAVEILIGVVSFVSSLVLSSFLPCGGCLLSIPFLLAWLAMLVVRVLCVVKGINGERFEVPWLSQFASSF